VQDRYRPDMDGVGSRGYYLDAANAGVDAFDPMLDKIDSDWRDYITTGRNRPLIP
jgi:hypothetical protein